jgi:hypothetical protein
MLHIESDTYAGYGENQDALVVKYHPKDPSLLLVAIADGQGGQPGGKQAAQLACQLIVDEAAACRPLSLIWTRKWQQLLVKTDKALRANDDAGFTTLIAYAVKGCRLYGAAGGDSALMAVTANDVKILTKGQQKNPPVGSGQAQAFGINFVLHPPWTLLAMTDGVWKFAGWEKIWDSALEVTNPKNMIESIYCSAKLPGGGFQDDFTMVVIQEDGKT